MLQFLPMADGKSTAADKEFSDGEIIELAELVAEPDGQEVCCGGPPPPRSSPMERPGYSLQPYVRGFIKDRHTDVALVKTRLEWRDHVGTVAARLGLNRDSYLVSPGLYGIGRPTAEAPVIVTANYKLTFDAVRRELRGVDCWLLVLDTCGINVWCAAGKRTFSTEELVRQVARAKLASRVNHRRLIVPQLGATGVAAHRVRALCGFRVVYGPVRASDIVAFLENDLQATTAMRAVTFTWRERSVLIPVEFSLFGKKIWWLVPLFFLLSGLSPSLFSVTQAWQRGMAGIAALIVAMLAGAMMVPLLLPWIPGRAFALKGALAGLAAALLFVQQATDVDRLDKAALMLLMTAVSSYLAMNFTGSTPYTSLSGVEKEMKMAMPLQALAAASGIVLWLAGPFF